MNCLKISFPLKNTITLIQLNIKMEYKIYLKQIPVEICYANADQARQTGAPLTVCALFESSS